MDGTVWSATAHIVSALMGSGVLALAWTFAQLGWIAGPVVLVGLSVLTYYTSALLADCYRFPNATNRMIINRSYIDAVRSYLGPRKMFICGWAQYASLWVTLVGCTITAGTSAIAVSRVNCFHRHGHGARCDASGNIYMVAFGVFQLILSQFSSLENITWLSVIAVATSFGYSFISLDLCIAKWVSHGHLRGTLGGVSDGSSGEKAFNVLLAIGNMVFSYAFSDVLIEIQDTLKSPPPENKTMKKATFYGVGLTTIFYLALGFIGYAAFGNNAPGNILTGSGFYEPFWLVDIANICVVVHFIGAYQVYAQPIFFSFENYIASQWPEARFVHTTYHVRVPFTEVRSVNFTPSKLALRSILILFATLVAMLLPFFNAILGLIGALGFWPLSVYFPIGMHMAQQNIRRGARKWFFLHGLSFFCLLISVGASISSAADIVHHLRGTTPFKTVY